MKPDRPSRYSLENLQQTYSLPLKQAAAILRKVGSDKRSVDRFLKHCLPRNKT
jgi:hypothetical protein